MKIGAGVAGPKKGAWPSLGVPRELHDAVEGASWESEVGVPAPALLPTCSVTLGRSLADSGLQAFALHGGGARSPGTWAARRPGGQPWLSGLFLLGLRAVTHSSWNQKLRDARRSPKVMQHDPSCV